MDSGNDADANHTHDTNPINSIHEEINAQPIALTCMGQRGKTGVLQTSHRGSADFDVNRIHIKMSMTAPGCGMGNVLKGDVQNKLARLPGVKEAHVEVVFDPPWHPGLMSDAAKLQLGFDLDYGITHASPPFYGERK